MTYYCLRCSGLCCMYTPSLSINCVYMCMCLVCVQVINMHSSAVVVHVSKLPCNVFSTCHLAFTVSLSLPFLLSLFLLSLSPLFLSLLSISPSLPFSPFPLSLSPFPSFPSLPLSLSFPPFPLSLSPSLLYFSAITIQFTSSVFAADYDPTIGEQLLYSINSCGVRHLWFTVLPVFVCSNSYPPLSPFSFFRGCLSYRCRGGWRGRGA